MSQDIRIVVNDHAEVAGKLIDGQVYVPFPAIEQEYGLYGYWAQPRKTFHIRVARERITLPDGYRYDPKGNYLKYELIRVENWNVRMDASGIPQVIRNGACYYNPCTIAQYGLQYYCLYLLHGRADDLRKCRTAAEWLLRNQDGTGNWPYPFDFTYNPKCYRTLIRAPWYSAIAAGQALSLLTRMHRLEGKPAYLQAALKALGTFRTSVDRGGVLAKYQGRYDFYEEVPTSPHSYILNGFMFALIGLYDASRAAPNSGAGKLYANGMATLKRMLPLYDLGYRSAYDLSHHMTDVGYPNPGKWGYHVLHIHQLIALNSIERDPAIGRTIERWKGYLQGKVVRRP